MVVCCSFMHTAERWMQRMLASERGTCTHGKGHQASEKHTNRAFVLADADRLPNE